MKIEKVHLNGVELSEADAKSAYDKYVTTHIARECFWGGIAIETPDGTLQATVSLN